MYKLHFIIFKINLFQFPTPSFSYGLRIRFQIKRTERRTKTKYKCVFGKSVSINLN